MRPGCSFPPRYLNSVSGYSGFCSRASSCCRPSRGVSSPCSTARTALNGYLDLVELNRQSGSNDRISLVTFDSTATANQPLGTDVAATRRALDGLTAGGGTNIGAGMKLAREELEKNARKNAHRLMVVMTDGVANKPSSTTQAKAFVLQEAQAAKASKIQILTISMGALADTNLMQQVLPNTARFGAVEIPRSEYLRRLAAALALDPGW